MLLCGLIEIDVDDWQRNTLYRGEYSNTHKVRSARCRRRCCFVRPLTRRALQVIKWFWSIVRGMTNDQRARLLQFVTGARCAGSAALLQRASVELLHMCRRHLSRARARLRGAAG